MEVEPPFSGTNDFIMCFCYARHDVIFLISGWRSFRSTLQFNNTWECLARCYLLRVRNSSDFFVNVNKSTKIRYMLHSVIYIHCDLYIYINIYIHVHPSSGHVQKTQGIYRSFCIQKVVSLLQSPCVAGFRKHFGSPSAIFVHGTGIGDCLRLLWL